MAKKPLVRTLARGHARMPAVPSSKTTIVRAGARGAIGAMAMSGLRKVTTSIGAVEKTPPETVLESTASGLFHGASPEGRAVMVELVHWLYGAAGGAAFGALPRSARRHPWAGPVYGVIIWAVFETFVDPLLGLREKRKDTLSERAALIADHLLYGVVVAASPWPHHDRADDD
jgi:hypothetical protein